MKLKRGTDHSWKLVKYKGDIAIYAKCKCKYHYNCSRGGVGSNNSGDVFKQKPSIFYPYCPMCGARKKWYTEEIEEINKYEFEQ